MQSNMDKLHSITPPTPKRKHRRPLTSTNERLQTSKRMSKYTAPPNPQGDRPRSMRSLAINYRILPGSLDNTVRFSCLLSRSGDPWRGPSNWGLGTKDTQAHTHIPLALWYSGSLWMNPPYAFDGSRGGEAWRIWQWST